MSSRLIRDSILMTAIVVGGAVALTHRESVYDLIGVHPADFARKHSEVMAGTARDSATPEQNAYNHTKSLDGSSTAITKSADGQFWTEARVNASSIRFLVDTGASVVALTEEDAMKAGVDMRKLRYVTPINTAAGQIKAAPVTLKLVSVGNVNARNVRAVVIRKGLSHSLLGMSYLGELQTVQASKTQLILRQ